MNVQSYRVVVTAFVESLPVPASASHVSQCSGQQSCSAKFPPSYEGTVSLPGADSPSLRGYGRTLQSYKVCCHSALRY